MQGVHEAQTTTPERDGSEDGAAPSAPRASTRGRRWVRALVARRRWIGFAALLSLPVLGLLLDLGRRSDRILEFEEHYRFTYLAAFMESVLVWGTLLYGASARRVPPLHRRSRI